MKRRRAVKKRKPIARKRRAVKRCRLSKRAQLARAMRKGRTKAIRSRAARALARLKPTGRRKGRNTYYVIGYGGRSGPKAVTKSLRSRKRARAIAGVLGGSTGGRYVVRYVPRPKKRGRKNPLLQIVGLPLRSWNPRRKRVSAAIARARREWLAAFPSARKRLGAKAAKRDRRGRFKKNPHRKRALTKCRAAVGRQTARRRVGLPTKSVVTTMTTRTVRAANGRKRGRNPLTRKETAKVLRWVRQSEKAANSVGGRAQGRDRAFFYGLAAGRAQVAYDFGPVGKRTRKRGHIGKFFARSDAGRLDQRQSNPPRPGQSILSARPISWGEARKAPGFAEAVKGYIRFHRASPVRAQAVEIADGGRATVTRAVFAMGQAPEMVYQALPGQKSNKQGKGRRRITWVHRLGEERGRKPLLVHDPKSGVSSFIGGTYAVRDWVRR